MILDFSKPIEFPNPTQEWEKQIIDFIHEWKSETKFITAQTSGSTGEPKPIQLPKSAMKISAQLTGDFFGLKKGKTALLCLPVNFIAGKMMLVRAIELGLKLYCIEPKSYIDLSSFPSLDFVPMTPLQVESSLDSISKVKQLLIGGAPLSEPLRNQLSKFPTQSFESYGMTETITHIALKTISEENFTVLNQVQISQDDRNCLVIQTPYFDEKIITNDVIEIIDNQHFKWLGRFDNVINSGGIKLFPEQIEKKLKPFIEHEFIISSIPDLRLGQKLILIIENKNSYSIDFRKMDLSKFEVPKEVYFVTSFPRTESGKIKRNEVLAKIKI